MIKAVVVGINNYLNFPDQPLFGCQNDAEDVMSYLTDKLGVAHDDIVPLYDENATKAAIVQALRDLIASASAGDHLLFHYSGHGAQIVSDSAGEPDGLDEVLCPYDFAFADRSTALTDKEIAVLLGSVPGGQALTMVVDACHSGDISRPLSADKTKDRPRFLRPKADYLWRLANRKPVRNKSLANPSAVTVSACASVETAADTSYNGRPCGAFTHNWLASLGATPKASIDDLVAATAKPLQSYNMHPEDAGAGALRAASFLIDPPPMMRALMPAVLGRALLFDQTWSTSVMGLPVSVELRISQVDSGFQLDVTPEVAGIRKTISIPVDGDQSYPIPVPYIGQLIVGVSDWSVSGSQLDFNFSLALQPSIPFLPRIPICNQHIAVPITAQRALPVPQSAADFVAMLQLLQMGGGAMPAQGRGLDPINTIPYSYREGVENWGPNWKENRTISIGHLPPGVTRVGVNLSAQNGQGNVYVVGWSNDDIADGDFVLHIGNNFFGGWGSIRWSVMVVNQYIVPDRDLRPATTPTNGNGHHPVVNADTVDMAAPPAGSLPA